MHTSACFEQLLVLEFVAPKFSMLSVEDGTLTPLDGVEAQWGHRLTWTYHKRPANVRFGPLDAYVVNNAAGTPLYVVVSQNTDPQSSGTSLQRIVLTQNVELL